MPMGFSLHMHVCLSVTAEPPPKYRGRSVTKRVRAAKQESTSKAGFVKALPDIFTGSRMYSLRLVTAFRYFAALLDIH